MPTSLTSSLATSPTTTSMTPNSSRATKGHSQASSSECPNSLEYQLPPLHEMSRSVALFGDTTPTRPPKVIRPGWDRELFGTDLISFIAAGEMLHTASRPNSGRFNPKWLDQPNFEFVADYINPDHLRAGLDNYVADAATIAASNGRPKPSPWRRLDFNPLLGRPAIRGLHDDLPSLSPHSLSDDSALSAFTTPASRSGGPSSQRTSATCSRSTSAITSASKNTEPSKPASPTTTTTRRPSTTSLSSPKSLCWSK